MKKLVITLAAVAIVGNFAFAEYKTTIKDLSNKNVERLVAFVLEKNKAGYSKADIVAKIVKNPKEFGIVNYDVKPELYKEKYELKKETYKDNFGQYKKSLRRGERGEEVKLV